LQILDGIPKIQITSGPPAIAGHYFVRKLAFQLQYDNTSYGFFQICSGKVINMAVPVYRELPNMLIQL